jgi:hypothetical protein
VYFIQQFLYNRRSQVFTVVKFNQDLGNCPSVYACSRAFGETGIEFCVYSTRGRWDCVSVTSLTSTVVFAFIVSVIQVVETFI